jgi:hypothetical protein
MLHAPGRAYGVFDLEQRGTQREKTAREDRCYRRESADPHLHLVYPALAAR